MRRLQNVFLLLALMAAVACGGAYDPKLVEIDSLAMNSEPQRAAELLDSLAKTGLSEKNRKYADLLRLKAQYMTRTQYKSDSGVPEMVEYFEEHDVDKTAEAYYFAATVYRDMRDAPLALEYYQKCIDALPEDDLSKMKGNCYAMSGDLYRLQMMREKAVEMYQGAVRVGSQMKDTVRMAEALSFIGPAYATHIETEDYNDSVYPYMERALELAKAVNHKQLVATISSKFMYFHSKHKEYDEMLPYVRNMEEYLAENDNKVVEIFYKHTMLDSLMDSHNYELAHQYCDFILGFEGFLDSEFQVSALRCLYQIYAERGDVARSADYMNRYEELTSKNKFLKAQEATAQVMGVYNYSLRERDNLTLKAENERKLYMLVIPSAVFVALLLAFWLFIVRQRQKQQSLHQQIARLSQFEKLLREQNEATAERQDIARQKLVETEAYKMLQRRMADDRPLSDADLALLDETVNQICNGFKSTLYSAYNLSTQEYAVCLLLKFELSTTEISNLLGRTKSAITMRRKRLFRKLFGKDGDANELDTYIRSL